MTSQNRTEQTRGYTLVLTHKEMTRSKTMKYINVGNTIHSVHADVLRISGQPLSTSQFSIYFVWKLYIVSFILDISLLNSNAVHGNYFCFSHIFNDIVCLYSHKHSLQNKFQYGNLRIFLHYKHTITRDM
jgi:hypothetical protein